MYTVAHPKRRQQQVAVGWMQTEQLSMLQLKLNRMQVINIFL